MSEFIQMPDVNELKEELAVARQDIQEAVQDEPEFAEQSKFLLEILSSIDAKIAGQKDLSALSKSDQISILAHLNLFYSMLEDMFGDSLEDFDDEEDFDFDEEDETVESEEE
ncbi:MAG TPA: hypothetical protein PLC42_00350 [Parachlamydiaceae bacterium]|nr:hypothetical protein [Parachlamydiaceae bacterium]